MVTLQAVGSKPAAVMVAAEVAEAVHAYEACGVVKEID
jgi:hypothetical protein